MIEMGIEVSCLMNSKIFQYEFDYDEWPGTHTNNETYKRPYNGSIFEIRTNYKSVFPEKDFAPIENEDGTMKVMDSSKIYKIKYSINLLSLIGAHIDIQEDDKG